MLTLLLLSLHATPYFASIFMALLPVALLTRFMVETTTFTPSRFI